MNLTEHQAKNLYLLTQKTLKKIEELIENYYSQHLNSTITYLELFYLMKLQDKMTLMEKDLLIFLMKKEQLLVSKLIKAFKLFQELMMKTGPQEWILLPKEPKNTMIWVVDSANGETLSKLVMISHLNQLFKKLHGIQQDMPLFAKLMVQLQLLNQKFYLMDLILLKFAKK